MDERDRLSALERANEELRRENARLAREKLGTADAAAASLLGRLQRTQSELKEAQRQLRRFERHVEAERAREEWIAELHAQIEHLRGVVASMESTRTWRLGAIYWRTRDRLAGRSRRSSP